MTSRCGGCFPLERSASRCSTPKRCCSSTTTRPRSWNWTLSSISAWVPMTIPASPVTRSSSACRRAADAHGTGEQDDLGAQVGAAEHSSFGQLPHHLGDGAVVLLGEHLGGGEHRGLAARVDDGEHRAQGDHRLSRAHLALQQPVHRVFGRQVAEDLPGDLLLAFGEGEGQLGVEGVEQAAGDGSAGHRGELGVGVTAAGECDLEDEGLVPAQPVPRGGDVRLGLRAVDPEQRLRQRDESASLAQRLGQRVHRVLRAGQDGVDGLGDPPGVELLAGRVDRQQLPGERVDGLGHLGRVVGVLRVEELVRGVRQLHLAVEDGHLAREHRPPARQELLVGLVDAVSEEDQLEPAAAVGEGDLQPLAPAVVEHHDPRVGDLGDDRHMLVERKLGERREAAPLLVAPRVVVQQITDRVQVEVFGHHLRGGSAEQLLEGFIESGHAVHCTPRH